MSFLEMRRASGAVSAGLGLALCAALGHAADVPDGSDEGGLVPAEEAVTPPVRVTFVPPELEGRFEIGVFDGRGSLVRSLEAGPDDFDIGLNGYVLTWDGKTDAGARAAGGRYAVRGIVVGGVVVEGERFEFNDWAARDGVRARAVRLAAEPDAEGRFIVSVSEADGGVRVAAISSDGTVAWLPGAPAPASAEGATASAGRWKIEPDGAVNVLRETGDGGEVLRELRGAEGEPQVVDFAVGPGGDALLLHESDGTTERVRVLRRSAAADDFAGAGGGGGVPESRPVDWDVVFERSRSDCGAFGIRGAELVPDGGELAAEIEIEADENLLVPGERALRLRAVARDGRTGLETENGLRVATVSEGGGWSRVGVRARADGSLEFLQGDGVVVEVYRITGAVRVAEFDAGEFLLADPAAGD